jgi:hypothetical protein
MPIQIIPSHCLSCLSLGDVSWFTTWFVLSMFHLCLTFFSNYVKAFSSFSNMSLSIYLYLNHLIKWVSHFLRCIHVAKCTQQRCCAKCLCVHGLENHLPCGIVDALLAFIHIHVFVPTNWKCFHKRPGMDLYGCCYIHMRRLYSFINLYMDKL